MNPGAFDVALNKFNGLMWALSRRFGKGLVGLDVEDVIQECHIKLLELLESHSHLSDSDFSALLAKSCINRMHDLRKKQKNLASLVVDLEDISFAIGEDNFSELFLQHYQEHLSLLVPNDAVLLLNELLNPSIEAEAILFKQNLRKRHLQMLGIKADISNRITHQLAGQVLGFHPSKTKKLIKKLQLACITHLGIRPWTCRQVQTVA